MTAFEKNGLKIEFAFGRSQAQASVINITLSATNSNSQPLNDFVFQAAVPKVLSLGNNHRDKFDRPKKIVQFWERQTVIEP